MLSGPFVSTVKSSLEEYGLAPFRVCFASEGRLELPITNAGFIYFENSVSLSEAYANPEGGGQDVRTLPPEKSQK